MNRRQILRLGGLTITVPLVGCVSTGTQQSNPTRTTAEPNGELEEESAFSVTETDEIPVVKRTNEFADLYPDDKPFAEVVVGEKPENSDNPHGVRLFNEYENPRDIALTVNTGADSQTLVFEGEGTVSTDAYLALAIWRPSHYTIDLAVNGENGQLQKTFDVPQSAWDGGAGEEEGNSSSQHNVHIRENEIEVNFVGAG